jgi:uncharacterized protein (TIGR02391 family)
MDIKLLLAPRIEKHCRGLLESGEYKHAAREALVQVELALRGKTRLGPEFFGTRLIQRVFKGHQGVVLKVPLGEELQQKAQNYFEGVFSYYRNYVAHDGAYIDEASSVRILIIASELLEMLAASSLSLEDLGGIEGLTRVIQCENPKRLLELLLLLDGYWMPELTYDGLFEELYKNGFSDEQFQLVFELGLVFMNGFQTHDPMFEELTEMERLELTELGGQVVEQIKTK